MARKIDFTEPLGAEDAAYVADRPWLLQDAELAGLEVTYLEDDFDEEEEGEDPDPYLGLSSADLKKEIAERNGDPERTAEPIKPDSNSKDDMIKALRLDDQAAE